MKEGENIGADEFRDIEKNEKPRLTIRQLREAAQKESLANESARATRVSQDVRARSGATTQKKKTSFFGGLFQVREPTQVALNQVAAQIIAQHGSTSATKVPNVRLEKMPDFVPKVNSKWDGIPDAVKQREKREKEREKQRARRESFFRVDSKSGSEDGRHRNLTNSSSDTYGNSSCSQGTSSRTRFYAQSVNSSGDLASQHRAQHLHSSPGPTIDRLVEHPPQSPRVLTAPDTKQWSKPWLNLELQAPKTLATDYSFVQSKSTKAYIGALNETADQAPISATNQASYSPASVGFENALGSSTEWTQASSFLSHLQASPQPSASVSETPRTSLPITASQYNAPLPKKPIQKLSLLAALRTSGPDTLALPIVRTKNPLSQNADAFLAGEAQELVLHESDFPRTSGGITSSPGCNATANGDKTRVQQDLEKRPDSSRDRLGLRASMLFMDPGTPWDMQEARQPLPPAPESEKHTPNSTSKNQKSSVKHGI